MNRIIHPHYQKAGGRQAWHHVSKRGVSLVLVIVMMSSLMVLMLIFARLISTGVSVTRSYSNVFKSEMAVQAGLADAQNLLLELFSKYPDSVTYWDPRLGDTTTPGTVFMWRKVTPDQTYTSTQSQSIRCRPLISGATEQEFYPSNDYVKTLTSSQVEVANSVDINALPYNAKNDEFKRWVGVILGNRDNGDRLKKDIRVPWVEILKDSTQPKDDTVDATTGEAKNPAVARYAYWIEDESFKLNVNTTQAKLREQKDQDSSGKNSWMPSWRGWFDSDSVASALERVRTELKGTNQKLLSASQIAHASSLPDGSEKFWTKWRPYLTADSSGLNLSRTGAKRLNINTAATDNDTASAVEQSVKRIVMAIESNQPHFGQRFYRSSASVTTSASYPVKASDKQAILNVVGGSIGVPTTAAGTGAFSHEQIYLYKIAANIHDYISTSPNPTILKVANGTVLRAGPVYSLQGLGIDQASLRQTSASPANPLMAVGKKAIPYLTEYMMSAKVTNLVPGQWTKPAYFEFEIDHYFQFWNPTNKEIKVSDLGTDAYIALDNQPEILASGDGVTERQDIAPGRAFFIPLGSIPYLVFKPGAFTIITTDPNWSSSNGILGIPTSTKVCVATEFRDPKTGLTMSGARSMGPVVAGGTVSNIRLYGCTTSELDGNNSRPEVQIGHEWENNSNVPNYYMGNSAGLLDAQPALRMTKPSHSNLVALRVDQWCNYRGSYVAGTSRSQEGDPRAKLEALELVTTSEDFSAAKAGYYYKGNGALSGRDVESDGSKSLGDFGTETAAPPTFLAAKELKFWNTDRCTALSPATYIPMVNPQDKMKSIAELGHIYDPMRVALSDLTKVRGGGRTLTIGQADYLWDGTRSDAKDYGGQLVFGTGQTIPYQLSNSRGWAAWRLCDIFTVREKSDMTGVDYDEKSPQEENRCEIAGLYNPNGILRDEGLVLQTLLRGISYDATQPNLSSHGRTFETTTIANTSQDPPSSLIWTESDRIKKDEPRTVPRGGLAIANYLARRLTRAPMNDNGATLWRFSPLWEPGELSQLECFGISSTSYLDTSVGNDALFDREREGLFRRLCEMVTSKGNTFSIYIVGQIFDKAGKVSGSKSQRVTVRLHPVWKKSLVDDFDPSSTTSVRSRFSPPDLYRAEVISVEER